MYATHDRVNLHRAPLHDEHQAFRLTFQVQSPQQIKKLDNSGVPRYGLGKETSYEERDIEKGYGPTLKESRLKPPTTLFLSERSYPEGIVDLALLVGSYPLSRTIMLQFHILKSTSKYNVILGIIDIQKLSAEVSTIRLIVEFPTKAGTITVRSDYPGIDAKDHVRAPQGSEMIPKIAIGMARPGSFHRPDRKYNCSLCRKGVGRAPFDTSEVEAERRPDHYLDYGIDQVVVWCIQGGDVRASKQRNHTREYQSTVFQEAEERGRRTPGGSFTDSCQVFEKLREAEDCSKEGKERRLRWEPIQIDLVQGIGEAKGGMRKLFARARWYKCGRRRCGWASENAFNISRRHLHSETYGRGHHRAKCLPTRRVRITAWKTRGTVSFKGERNGLTEYTLQVMRSAVGERACALGTDGGVGKSRIRRHGGGVSEEQYASSKKSGDVCNVGLAMLGREVVLG
ncbi:hypothetical protein Tco_1056709 [Tanacetum coccineum]|uniref:Uncharacterized protein n=1 Tax=Tanacetum coccineum TaxID=301880 RepID=A0ABQ5H3B4_9ASTR